MKSQKTVSPKRVSNWYIPFWSNMFGIKISFDCGKCGFSQYTKVSLENNILVKCQNCKTLNNVEVQAPESDED